MILPERWGGSTASLEAPNAVDRRLLDLVLPRIRVAASGVRQAPGWVLSAGEVAVELGQRSGPCRTVRVVGSRAAPFDPPTTASSPRSVDGGRPDVIYLAALKNVPRDLHEAAMIDGAGAWMRFRKVTVPMISGVLFFTFVVLSISALQMFDQVYTMYFGATGTNNGNTASLFYVIYLFQQAFADFRMGYASALAWLLFLIIITVTLIQVRVSRRFVYYESEEG